MCLYFWDLSYAWTYNPDETYTDIETHEMKENCASPVDNADQAEESPAKLILRESEQAFSSSSKPAANEESPRQ